MTSNERYEVLEQVELPAEDASDYPSLALDDSEQPDDPLDDFESLAREVRPPPQEQQGALVGERPALADDFVRNFLQNVGLTKSLECFQNEWYEKQAAGELPPEDTEVVRDLLFKNQQMYDEVRKLEEELAIAKQCGSKAIANLDQFKKERDFHRAQYKQCIDEKKELGNDLKRLKTHFESYEPALVEMRHHYEVCMKEKMLLRIERDRVADKIEALQQANSKQPEKLPRASLPSMPSRSSAPGKKKLSRWPNDATPNPHLEATYPELECHKMKATKSFANSHIDSIARIRFHPTKACVFTAGDDHVWKMWALPNGELAMSGEGHLDWIGGLDVHPKLNVLATGSGDTTVKLWSIEKEKCTHTFTDHSQGVFGVAFHHEGNFLASCSMDQHARVFDLEALKCRTDIKDHCGHVNHVCFHPSENNCLATASEDKTVSLWDMRTGHSSTTLYGHENAVNHCAFSQQGHLFSTGDANGCVKVWDARASLKELMHVDCSAGAVDPVNSTAFERAGKTLVIACGDGSLKFIDTVGRKLVGTACGAHEDQVQDVQFDPNGKFMATCSSDRSWKIWG